MRKKILLCAIVLMLAMTCIVSNALAFTAADGARMITGNEEEGIMPLSENEEEGIMPISDTEGDFVFTDAINKDVYESSEMIEKNGEIVDGNTYLFANSVTVENEIINGDVFICANNVKLGSEVIVNGNLFICALNVKSGAIVTRGVYVVAKDIVLESSTDVKYDANICADHVILCGNFDRDVNVFVNNMEVTSDTIILQDLNYVSDKEASISGDANIVNINFEKQIRKNKEAIDIIYEYVLDFTQYFVLTFAILIIVIKFIPNFIKKAKQCVRVSAFGLGIVAIVLAPIIFIIMMMLRATATFGMVALAILIALLLISMAITNIAIGAKLSDKVKKIKLPISVAIVTVISWAIFQIPFFGGIVAFFMVATGLGIVLKSNFVKVE